MVLTGERENIQLEIIEVGGVEVGGVEVGGIRILPPNHSRRTIFAGSRFAVQKFQVSSLRPERAYLLRVRDAEGVVRDEREFRSLDLRKNSVRIAVLSCLNDRYAESRARMWTRLAGETPDLVIFGGDNVYVDAEGEVSSPLDIWRRYVETRGSLKIFRLRPLFPILATWDDHDFGSNDGGRDFRFRRQSREIFETFFGQEPRPDMPEMRRGPGIATHLRAFGGEIVLLDDRSFRSPITKGRGTQWGQAQEAWMYDILNGAQGPVWLVNGSQYFGKYHRQESVERDHPYSLSRLVSRMKTARVPTLLVSGDMHFSEVMRIEPEQAGYETFEITSSGMHAPQVPMVSTWLKNSRRIMGTWKNNFVLIQAAVVSPFELKLRVRSLGMERADYFRRDLVVRKKTR